MQLAQITIRDIPNSDALETHIQEKAQKLTQFHQHINSCRVVVEMPQKHKHQGKLFNVKVDLSVPGKELVVTHKKNEDVYIAIRDAFHALARQLESYAQRKRGHVKHHDKASHGEIIRLFPEEGYGFIEGVDGDERYFTAASVAFPRFKKLSVGDKVRFLTHIATRGLQAQRVTLAKQNHFA